jgi:hypothetical protein
MKLPSLFIHQSFTPSSAAQATDLLPDASGDCIHVPAFLVESASVFYAFESQTE